MVKAIERQSSNSNGKPRAASNGAKTARPPRADKSGAKPRKDGGKGAKDVDKSKKIAKPAKTMNELQSHYQRIVINIKKKKLNKELLNKSIGEFLQYFAKNSSSLTAKVLGAKALQLCLKYGTSSHRETIVLLLLKNDFVSLCGATYGGFIISKIFRYCEQIESIKVVRDFFRKNFKDLIKKKEHLVAVNAYISAMDEKTALNYLEKELSGVKLDEFYFHELVEYAATKPSIMKLSLLYYLVYHFFDTIAEEQRAALQALILKHADDAINKSEQKYFVVLCVLKNFLNVNFKNKKEIIKKFLKEGFLEYFGKHAGFVYLLVALLKKISDQKVTNITILKALKAQTEAFFNSVDVAKLVELLFSEEAADKLQKDRFFKCNAAVKRLLEIEGIDKDPVYRANVRHIRRELVAEPELLSQLTFETLKTKSSENSAYSLLFSSLLEQMCKGKLSRAWPAAASRRVVRAAVRLRQPGGEVLRR